jgi:hypothetical protein
MLTARATTARRAPATPRTGRAAISAISRPKQDVTHIADAQDQPTRKEPLQHDRRCHNGRDGPPRLRLVLRPEPGSPRRLQQPRRPIKPVQHFVQVEQIGLAVGSGGTVGKFSELRVVRIPNDLGLPIDLRVAAFTRLCPGWPSRGSSSELMTLLSWATRRARTSHRRDEPTCNLNNCRAAMPLPAHRSSGRCRATSCRTTLDEPAIS